MAELGRKMTCSECGAKFYDLGRAEATCPKCGHSQPPVDDTAILKRSSKRSKAAPATTAAKKIAGKDGKNDGKK